MADNTQHTFRKRWGQNFLADTNLLRKIVMTVCPENKDSILEIGPGEGALTEQILPLVQNMAAIEIDPKLIGVLNSRKDLQKCHFIHQDVLRQKLNELPIPTPLKIIGNIPYNITSPIIFWLLEQRNYWTEAYLMVQKEMAERLTGDIGTKSYGRLTITVGAIIHVETCFTIRPEVFIPQPRVRSAIIKLIPKEVPLVPDEHYERFKKIVKAAFSQRRKMLRNTLSGFGFSNELIDEIDFSRRPETLSILEFARLSKG